MSLFLAARTRLPSAFASGSAANLRWNNRGLPTRLQALAILVPLGRGYSTETSTSTTSGSFPPPGFNAEQAKKPLPTETPKSSLESPLAPDANLIQPATPKVELPAKNESQQGEKPKLNELGAAKAAVAEAEKRVPEKDKEQKKLTIGQKIKKEIQHYWDGTKLLATEVKISTKLVMKMAAGYELSRRENRQVRQDAPLILGQYVFRLLTLLPYSCKGQ